MSVTFATPDNWWRLSLSVLLPNLGGPCPSFRDHRIEFAIVQHRAVPNDSAADFDHYVVLFPTRPVAHVPTEPQRRRPAVCPQDRGLVMKRPRGPKDLPTGSDRHVVLFPTRYAPQIPDESQHVQHAF